MNNDEFIFPGCENIEKKEDKKIWYWGECIKDAVSVGCKMGTIRFWVVYKIRVYETHGDYKFCVAGADRLAQDIGCEVTPRQVEIALEDACKKGQLFHIWCDKRVYRNKTKIYVTKQWLEKRGLNPETLAILTKGRKNTHFVTGTALKNGEVVNVKAVENDLKTKGKTLETKVETLETKVETLETKVETLGLPRMNKCKNVLKGMSVNECTVTKVTEQMLEKQTSESIPLEGDDKNALESKVVGITGNKAIDDEPIPQVPPTPLPSKKVRVLDEDGKVKGGHPYTERAYELWKEIMGQPCKRNKWNSQAGWNMMRAKNKGEEWLRGMIILARECKKDSKADYRASHVANLFDLQKNQEYVLDWYRKKQLEKSSLADKSLEFLRGKR